VTKSPLPAAPGEGLAALRRAVYEFAAAERRLSQRYKQAGEVITPSELRLLLPLLQGDLTHGQLAQMSDLNPPTVTLMLERVERAGLITRRRDEGDRRVWWISFTDSGRAVAADLSRQWDRRFTDAFVGCRDEDLSAAGDILLRVAAIFDGIG
jgi:DNA-binding MarR family transcriptional regulator